MAAELLHLPAFTDPKHASLRVVIETPKGSRNKYSLNAANGLLELKGVLTAGAYFPYDFGFVPSTKGEDGDPLDVLVLMDEPAFPGCLLEARLLGVIEAEQTKKAGEKERNDRLIAVPAHSRTHESVQTLDDLPDHLLTEIEHFFISYNAAKGKRFKPLGRRGVNRARKLVEEGMERFRNEKSRRTGRKRKG